MHTDWPGSKVSKSKHRQATLSFVLQPKGNSG